MDASSPGWPGRWNTSSLPTESWRKHRFNQEDEFVIGGYIPGGQNFSELLIGEERDKQLIFIKRLIAGFVPHTRTEAYRGGHAPMRLDKAGAPLRSGVRRTN
jgi:hypothetical protein